MQQHSRRHSSGKLENLKKTDWLYICPKKNLFKGTFPSTPNQGHWKKLFLQNILCFIEKPSLPTNRWCTLPETNIAPENRPSQKESSIPTIHFQVRAVSFREGSTFIRQVTCSYGSSERFATAVPSSRLTSEEWGFPQPTKVPIGIEFFFGNKRVRSI